MPTARRTVRPTSPRSAPPAGLPAVTVGRLCGQTARGEPLVAFPGSPPDRPLVARSTAAWTTADIGAEVALAFDGGRATDPIILGVLRPTPAAHPAVEVTADGQQVRLTAGKRVELRCGKASITLTSAGKVLIRGEYVLSRSAGVNRVKGAAVEIN